MLDVKENHLCFYWNTPYPYPPYSVMVEGSGEEVPEDMICEAVHLALSEVRA